MPAIFSPSIWAEGYNSRYADVSETNIPGGSVAVVRPEGMALTRYGPFTAPDSYSVSAADYEAYDYPPSSVYWGPTTGQSFNQEYKPHQAQTVTPSGGNTGYAALAFGDRFATPQQTYTTGNNNKTYNVGNNAVVVSGSAQAKAMPWLARADVDPPGYTSLLAKPGNFTPYKANIGGQVFATTREEKAASYSTNFPELYNAYTSGKLTDNQLFSQAMTDAVKFDDNRLGYGTTPAGTAISFNTYYSSANASAGGGDIFNTSNYNGIFSFKSISTNWNTSGKSIGGSIYKGVSGMFNSGGYR